MEFRVWLFCLNETHTLTHARTHARTRARTHVHVDRNSHANKRACLNGLVRKRTESIHSTRNRFAFVKNAEKRQENTKAKAKAKKKEAVATVLSAGVAAAAAAEIALKNVVHCYIDQFDVFERAQLHSSNGMEWNGFIQSGKNSHSIECFQRNWIFSLLTFCIRSFQVGWLTVIGAAAATAKAETSDGTITTNGDDPHRYCLYHLSGMNIRIQSNTVKAIEVHVSMRNSKLQQKCNWNCNRTMYKRTPYTYMVVLDAVYKHTKLCTFMQFFSLFVVVVVRSDFFCEPFYCRPWQQKKYYAVHVIVTYRR